MGRPPQEIAQPGYNPGVDLVAGRFPAFRISRGASLLVADDPVLLRLLRHMGDSAMPAEKMELLSRRRPSADLCQPDDRVDDRVSLACTFL